MLDNILQPQSLANIRHRLHLLKWLVPGCLVVVVVVFESGPSEWLKVAYGSAVHLLADLLLYGTLGPVLAYLGLVILERWLEERDTSELQAQALAQAHEQMRISRQLNDDALQTLFAASLLLDSIESGAGQLPPDVAAQLSAADGSLHSAIHSLRDHLLNRQPPK